MHHVDDVISENLGLVYKQLHKFHLVDDQDAESVAYEALYNAVRTYDQFSNTRFSTYATVCIYNALGTYVRAKNKKRMLEVISYNAVVYSDESTTCEFIDLMPVGTSIEDEYIQRQSIQQIYKLVKDLFEPMAGTRRQIIQCWMESDFTKSASEIAKEVSKSQSYVSQTLVSFRNKLKQRLKEEL